MVRDWRVFKLIRFERYHYSDMFLIVEVEFAPSSILHCRSSPFPVEFALYEFCQLHTIFAEQSNFVIQFSNEFTTMGLYNIIKVVF